MIKLTICLDYKEDYKSKENFVSKISKNIKISSIGYAGFKTKKYLQDNLIFNIFGYQNVDEIKKINFDKNKIKKIIKDLVKKCNKVLPLKNINVFIFPCFSPFVKNKMNGVSGYTPWKNTFLIFINPIKGWENKLKETVCHEYNHAVIYNYHKWQTLLDSLIFEGLAEHFRGRVIGGKKAPWIKALSKKEALLIFNKIKNKLNYKNKKLQSDLFYGTGNYPLWAGYTIGYYIVEEFLKKQKNINWNKIIKLNPKEILEKSNF